MKTYITTVLLLATTVLFAQRKPIREIDYASFMKDIQHLSTGNGELKTFTWMPGVFWEFVALQNPEFTQDMVDMIVKETSPYFVVLASNSSVGDYGFSNQSETSVERNLSVIVNGKTYNSLALTEISEAAVILKTRLEPAFSTMFGAMGKGLRLYFFSIQDEKGRNLIDPYGNQSFSIKFFDQQRNWQLPLASLMADKICNKDGRTFPSDYLYCPFHAVELTQPEIVEQPPLVEDIAKTPVNPSRKIVQNANLSAVKSLRDFKLTLNLKIDQYGLVDDLDVDLLHTTGSKDDSDAIMQVMEIVFKELKYERKPGTPFEIVPFSVEIKKM